MRTTSSGGITMMIIVAIILICITIGMFYTTERRKMKSNETENATLVTIKRERVMNITGVNIPLEKIIIKKVHSNGTIYEEKISGGRSGYQGKFKKTEKSRL